MYQDLLRSLKRDESCVIAQKDKQITILNNPCCFPIMINRKDYPRCDDFRFTSMIYDYCEEVEASILARAFVFFDDNSEFVIRDGRAVPVGNYIEILYRRLPDNKVMAGYRTQLNEHRFVVGKPLKLNASITVFQNGKPIDAVCCDYCSFIDGDPKPIIDFSENCSHPLLGKIYYALIENASH